MATDFLDQDLALNNQLLASLPAEDYQRLQPYLEPVNLTLGQVLYEVGEPITHAYFPIRSLISLISSALEHSETEFGLVGNEGMVGIPALLGGESTLSSAIVQVADSAMKIDADILKAEFARGGALQRQVLLYFQLFLTQTAQNTACMVHHQLKPRLARWLLSVQDRLECDELPLTQKYIALLLGTRRATITEAAGHLQQAGMIRYSRGRITILDRDALEQAACECYSLLRAEQSRLRAASQTIY
ncbi:MAG: Crp/Fnr family transcriptional regulator [Cyanobacteria bacterium P01_C01_bin.120]